MDRFARSVEHRQIAGVCGGIGEALNIDPAIIRILFIALSLMGGPGIILYIILWVILPEENDFPSVTS